MGQLSDESKKQLQDQRASRKRLSARASQAQTKRDIRTALNHCARFFSLGSYVHGAADEEALGPERDERLGKLSVSDDRFPSANVKTTDRWIRLAWGPAHEQIEKAGLAGTVARLRPKDPIHRETWKRFVHFSEIRANEHGVEEVVVEVAQLRAEMGDDRRLLGDYFSWLDSQLFPRGAVQSRHAGEPVTPKTLGEAGDWLITRETFASITGAHGKPWASQDKLKKHARPVWEKPRTAGYYRVSDLLAAFRTLAKQAEDQTWLAHKPEEIPISVTKLSIHPPDWSPGWASRATIRPSERA